MHENDYKGFFVITAIVVALAVGIYMLVTYRSEARVTVTQVAWSRAIEIQRYQTIKESAWSVPQGGRETRHYEAFHHSVTYISGYISSTSCSGKPITCRTIRTPIFSSYPVYETRYDYDIDRWVTVRTPERHGIGHAADWPDVSDLKEGDTLGAERAGMRISRYTVAFTQEYSLDISEERWRGFQPGQSAVLVLNIFKQALDVKVAS